MTKTTYKPGDLVERTGESALGLVKGELYVVREVTADGFLIFASDAEFNSRGFRLVEEE